MDETVVLIVIGISATLISLIMLFLLLYQTHKHQTSYNHVIEEFAIFKQQLRTQTEELSKCHFELQEHSVKGEDLSKRFKLLLYTSFIAARYDQICESLSEGGKLEENQEHYKVKEEQILKESLRNLKLHFDTCEGVNELSVVLAMPELHDAPNFHALINLISLIAVKSCSNIMTVSPTDLIDDKLKGFVTVELEDKFLFGCQKLNPLSFNYIINKMPSSLDPLYYVLTSIIYYSTMPFVKLNEDRSRRILESLPYLLPVDKVEHCRTKPNLINYEESQSIEYPKAGAPYWLDDEDDDLDNEDDDLKTREIPTIFIDHGVKVSEDEEMRGPPTWSSEKACNLLLNSIFRPPSTTV